MALALYGYFTDKIIVATFVIVIAVNTIGIQAVSNQTVIGLDNVQDRRIRGV